MVEIGPLLSLTFLPLFPFAFRLIPSVAGMYVNKSPYRNAHRLIDSASPTSSITKREFMAVRLGMSGTNWTSPGPAACMDNCSEREEGHG